MHTLISGPFFIFPSFSFASFLEALLSFSYQGYLSNIPGPTNGIVLNTSIHDRIIMNQQNTQNNQGT